MTTTSEWSPALMTFLSAVAQSGGAGFTEGLRAMSNARRRDLVTEYVIAPEVLNEATKAGLFKGGEKSVTLTSKGYTVIDALREPVTTQHEAPQAQRRTRRARTPKGPSGSSQGTKRGSHADCTHESTPRARAACRAARADA